MHTTISVLAFSLSVVCIASACGSTASSPSGASTGVDGGDAATTSDAANPMLEGGTTPDGSACTSANCTKAGFACDADDGKCKPDGKDTHIGVPCTRTGPGDPACGTNADATCNDQLNDGFVGGYCSVEPCTTAVLCPIGSSCGMMGGESGACYLNCKSDADCRTPEYKCQPMDQLAISGAAKSVCHLAQLPCAAPADCPSSLPKCTAKVCTK